MSELASELAAVWERARELASRELAAVREQEQAKCATGEQLQETLMEEAGQVQHAEDLVEVRLAPDGQGWYTEKGFNRFFSDDSQPWSECSTSKMVRHLCR